MKIWLLEDDPAQAQLLLDWLRSASHEVRHFNRAEDIKHALEEGGFDLLILDWELPDSTGIDVLGAVRGTVSWHVPVLFVTQRETETDIVTALANGADDYMVKQISKAEFLARVEALGRRLANEELEFDVGPYRFMPQSQSIELDGEPCELTAKDFELAWYLFRHIGRLLSREQLLKDVWGVEGLNTRTVDVHVSRVSKTSENQPRAGLSHPHHLSARLPSGRTMNAHKLKLALLLLGCSAFLPVHADDWLYTIRPGDELWSIAQTYCGSARAAEEIARHNGIADATRIRAGERIAHSHSSAGLRAVDRQRS